MKLKVMHDGVYTVVMQGDGSWAHLPFNAVVKHGPTVHGEALACRYANVAWGTLTDEEKAAYKPVGELSEHGYKSTRGQVK